MTRDAMLQGHAFEVLHHDESLPARLIDLVNSADIWVIEGRSGARFALKTLESLCVGGDVLGKELEGNEASQLDVLGLIDDTHASAAEFLDDAVMGDGLADHGSGVPS